MSLQDIEYGISVEVPLTFDRAVARTREELAKEGFGVLTEIDVKGTLKQKLDVEFRPYVILGACNPPLAHRALTAERDIGLLLPCNVIVYEREDAVVVSAIDPLPVQQLGITGKTSVKPLAEEVRSKLEKVIAALAD